MASAENKLKSPRNSSEPVSHSLKGRAGALGYRDLAKRRCRAPVRPKLRVVPQRVTLKMVRAGLHRLLTPKHRSTVPRDGRSVEAPDVRTGRCRAPWSQRYFYGFEFSHMDNNNRR